MDRIELTRELIATWRDKGMEGVVPLSETRLLSKRQIARVVGVSHTAVVRRLPGYQHEGGRGTGGAFSTLPWEGLRRGYRE